MIDLATLHPNLASIIEYKLWELSKAPVEEMGPLCDELNIFYRSAGVGALLLKLDVDTFHHMLIRSALTRIFLLRKTPPEAKEGSRYCKVSRAKGFFDAVAANRFDLAEQISNLSPKQWTDQYEYEEDYWYIQYLYSMIKGEEDERKQEILGQLGRVLEGTWPKYDVCLAFVERDATTFDEAFEKLLEARTEEIEFQKKSLSRIEEEFASERHVYVEGLGLLRIAERSGIRTREEYLYCPKEARMAMQTPFPNHGYPLA